MGLNILVGQRFLLDFFQNVHFWGCDILSCLLLIQSTQFFSVVACAYMIHVFDEAFFLLEIVAMITEKMYFSYFYGNICQIPSSNYAVYQSRLSLKKIESDRWSLLKKNRIKVLSCSPSIRSETLVMGSKCIRN